MGNLCSHSPYERRHPTVAADLAGRCLRSGRPGGNTRRRFVFWRCPCWGPVQHTRAGWAPLSVHGWGNRFVPDGLNRSVNTQTGMSSSSCRSFVLLSKSNSGLTVAVNWAVPLRLRTVCLQTTNIAVAALWSVQRSICSARGGINMFLSLCGLTFMLGFLFHAPNVINRKQKLGRYWKHQGWNNNQASLDMRLHRTTPLDQERRCWYSKFSRGIIWPRPIITEI